MPWPPPKNALNSVQIYGSTTVTDFTFDHVFAEILIVLVFGSEYTVKLRTLKERRNTMWEYKVVKVSTSANDIENQLNSFVQKGWELFSITPIAYADFPGSPIDISPRVGGYEAKLTSSKTEYCLITFRRST